VDSAIFLLAQLPTVFAKLPLSERTGVRRTPFNTARFPPRQVVL
jgi:hypothetical protein